MTKKKLLNPLTEDSLTSLTNAEIIDRIRDGETPLFELIMRRHNRLLFRLARGILHDDDEARDVVQEAYVSAYIHLDQFRGPDGFPTWISRITINEALTRVRKSSRLRPLDMDSENSNENIIALNLEGHETEKGPEYAAMTRETLNLVEAAIEKLPRDFRVVFILRGIEQLSVAETADHLGINPITVKTRFHRARKLVRADLNRNFESLISEAFPFAGQRCDQVVENVFKRLAELQKG